MYDGVLRLTNAPLPLQVVTVDDGVYEGTETIYLTLAQKDSSNNVTNGMGLTSETLSITLKDNDSTLHKTFKHCLQKNHSSLQKLILGLVSST